MAETTPYVKQTHVDGGSFSGAKATYIEEGIRAAHEQPAVRVYHNANQSITTSVATALAFNSERLDQAFGSGSTQHDVVTNNTRLTCRYAGVYMAGGSLDWAAGSTGFRQVTIRLNGSTNVGIEERAATAGSSNSQTLTTLYRLAVNDYVELFVAHTQGTALDVVTAGNYSPEFWMVRVA